MARKETTGNPSVEDKVMCALGQYNNVIEVSHFYYVTRNDKCVVGKPFLSLATFKWPNCSTKELAPVEIEPNKSLENTSEIVRNQTESNKIGNNSRDTLQCGGQLATHKSDTFNTRKENYFFKRVGSKCSKGMKAVKAEKRAKIESNVESDDLEYAPYSSLENFSGVSFTKIAGANVCSYQSSIHAEDEYKFRKDFDKLKAVRVLFINNGKGSKTYRNTLKKKHLRKLLEEEKHFSNVSWSPSAGGFHHTLE